MLLKKVYTPIFILSLCVPVSATGAEDSNLKMWYQKPADQWIEALPVGNGRLGAMVFGRIDTERIQLNEESLWAGKRINNNNPLARTHLQTIRNLLLQGRNLEARELSEKALLGTPPRIRSYQTLGDLNVIFRPALQAMDYRRELGLNTGLCRVRAESEGGSIQWEVFSSAPANLIAVHFEAQGVDLDFDLELERPRDARTMALDDRNLVMTGRILDPPDTLRGPGGAHMRFAARVLAIPVDGTVRRDGERLEVRDATELTLLITAATDYDIERLEFNGDIDPEKRCREILQRSAGFSYEEIKTAHIIDHASLFDRVRLDLGTASVDSIPTDTRLKQLQQGGAGDPHLQVLYFQLGRYLLMGSSRAPGILPANLQGIWNEHLEAPWNSDFHTNINLQMNYWPAQVCNLPETVHPLSGFFQRIREPGRVTASQMYGADGWTMHHVTDPFGRTGLMDGIQWGTFPMGASWVSLLFWRQYEFTLDRDYLREHAWPLMKGAAEFVLDFLIEDGQGRLVTAPSYSPENSFRHPGSGESVRLTYAPTMDIQIIRELFKACCEAGEILGEPETFCRRIQEAAAKLPAVRVGRDSTLMEWIEDYEEVEPGHRHMSHLFGLHPGTQITADTPDLLRAARRTIEKRLAHGGGHTGWSRAWIVNFYARFLDGDAAYEHLTLLLRKSTQSNLFDTHPPFQIDGNFGATAGMAEMLLQSHHRGVHLLPACPGAWKSGSVSGLMARGRFEVGMEWWERALVRATIVSHSGGPLILRYRDYSAEMPTRAGEKYVFDSTLNRLE